MCADAAKSMRSRIRTKPATEFARVLQDLVAAFEQATSEEANLCRSEIDS
jgi:hypothetical protein